MSVSVCLFSIPLDTNRPAEPMNPLFFCNPFVFVFFIDAILFQQSCFNLQLFFTIFSSLFSSLFFSFYPIYYHSNHFFFSRLLLFYQLPSLKPSSSLPLFLPLLSSFSFLFLLCPRRRRKKPFNPNQIAEKKRFYAQKALLDAFLVIQWVFFCQLLRSERFSLFRVFFFSFFGVEGVSAEF